MPSKAYSRTKTKRRAGLTKGSVAFGKFLTNNEIEQKDIAARLGIDASLINHLLKGRKAPSIYTARDIEDATRGEVPARLWADPASVAQQLAADKQRRKAS